MSETMVDFAESLAKATVNALAALEESVPALASSYEEVMQTGGRRMAREFKAKAQSLTADATFVPPDEDEVASTEATKEEMREIASGAQQQAAEEVAEAFEREGISFQVEQAFTPDMLDAIGERAAFAADETLRDTYRTVITEAAEDGWSIPRTAEAIIENVDSVSVGRAEALARTDLIGLANGGSVHVASMTKDPDQPLWKNWLATNDGRTRETHVEAHGQSVLVNESFFVGDAHLGYPGDPFGPPEEVMNCRCTVTYASTQGGTVVTAAVDNRPEGGLPSGGTEREESTMEIVETTEPDAVTADGDGVIEDEASTRLNKVDPIPWNATLCVEGEQTEDLRLLEAGSIRWRDLPLTLMGTLETSWGHMGAKATGRMDSITRVGANINSEGEFTSPFGVFEVAPLVDDRTVRGVSVDLAVFDYEYRDPDTGETLSDEEVFERWWFGEDMVFVVLDGVIIAATVCPMPAIANASIAITASGGLERTQRDLIAAALKDGGYGEKVSPSDVQIISVFTSFDTPKAPALFAAGVVELAAPPRAHFELSEFPGKTPLTVSDPDDAGWRRVFGHIATWDTCHVGIPGVCTTAPRSSTSPEYALFHQHQYDIAEGGTLDCGVLMLGTGHASLAASRMAATQHYDKPDMIGAYVRAHDGEHGIWVSGIVRPEITAAGLRELRSNPPSGDWRSYNRALELIAVCAVAVPGFPVVASAEANLTAAGGTVAIDALIASSGQIVPSDAVKDAMIAAGCACEEVETTDPFVEDLVDALSEPVTE